jgi:hypothetical protein
MVAKVALLALSACGRIGYDPVAAADADASIGSIADASNPLEGWAGRKAITFHPQSVPGGDLIDFTVAVAVTDDPDLSRGSALGPDVSFTAADGTPLAFELEAAALAEGSLSAWVKLPVLREDQDTIIYLYYGGTLAEPPQRGAAWGSAFTAVWHLPGSPSDGTANAHDGTATAQAASRPSLMGSASEFDGVDDQAIVMDAGLDFGTSSFSYSAWVHVTSNQGGFDMPFWNGGSSSSYAGYDLELGTANWNAGLSDGNSNTLVPFGPDTDFMERWVHLFVVVDRDAGQVQTFADGQLRALRGISSWGSLSATDGVRFGGMNSTNRFVGLLDEVRIYGRKIDQDWVAAEHANLATPQMFYTVGSDEPLQ